LEDGKRPPEQGAGYETYIRETTGKERLLKKKRAYGDSRAEELSESIGVQ